MSEGLLALCITAASIGFIHTITGPDHYLPFIMMARAQKWSQFKTTLVTLFCGLGHVMSSVVLGMIGVAFGVIVSRLEIFESVRGSMAAWAMIAFGLTYMVWGVHRGIKNKPHTHIHIHGDGEAHEHKHMHHKTHAHPHEVGAKKSITPWVLFTIFVLGPCEPLIPILMYPAVQQSYSGLFIVTGIFALTTISTMIAVVTLACSGIRLMPLGPLERYSHALAGGIIMASGMAITFLGL